MSETKTGLEMPVTSVRPHTGAAEKGVRLRRFSPKFRDRDGICPVLPAAPGGADAGAGHF